MQHVNPRNVPAKALAIALSVKAYCEEYQVAQNDNGRKYSCGFAILLWTTWEGERWSFSYFTPTGERVYDYTLTLREFESKEDAQQAMAGLVWALNGGHGEYPR